MATKIESTIRKLLRLAQSSNMHESANAAKRAQLLMEKHRIEVSLDDDAKEEFSLGEPLETFDEVVLWKGHLLDPICEVNGCRGLWIARGSKHLLCCAGPERDCNTVRYLYTYLSKEIERLACEGADHLQSLGQFRSRRRRSNRDSWMHSFRYGAITILTLRLREATEQAWAEAEAENPRALAVIEDRIEQADRVKEWVERDIDVKDGDPSVGELDLEAFNLGMRTAGNITLDGMAKLGDGEDTAASDG